MSDEGMFVVNDLNDDNINSKMEEENAELSSSGIMSIIDAALPQEEDMDMEMVSIEENDELKDSAENESVGDSTENENLDDSADTETLGDEESQDNSETMQNFDTEESPSDYNPGGYLRIAVGDNFENRYHVLKKLGWGHFSTVWLCHDIQTERYYALKVVKSAPHFTATALDEIRLLRFVAESSWHPLRERLVEMFNYTRLSGPNGSHLCLIFEAMGENLLKLIQRSNYNGLPLYNVKQIAKQVLEGLCFLHVHCRIIHTDLKPENVLLVADDLAVRTQASRAIDKYLAEHEKPGGGGRGAGEEEEPASDAKLTKSAKRRMRAKNKRNVYFFQTHRQWLRSRGIEDLLYLAIRGLVPTSVIALGVTGQLPFLPFNFDGLSFLDDEDLRQLECLEVGDTPAEGHAEQEQPPPQERGRRCRRKKESQTVVVEPTDSRSSMLKLLLTSPEKFLRYVKKRVQEQDQLLAERAKASASPQRKMSKTLAAAKSSSKNLEHLEPDLSMLSHKDPATQPCKLRVKIADLGNACFCDEHFTEDIQTSEYRAVEVLLGAGYTESADMWSAGCLFWELVTGDYLFDPQLKRDRASPNEAHIASIMETCGNIPAHLILGGTHSKEYFKNGKLRHVKQLHNRCLVTELIQKYGWPKEEAEEFMSFLMPMLHTNPTLRCSALEAVQHRWLRIDENANDVK